MEPLCTACGWRAPAGVCVCVWGGRGGQGGETGWRAPACHACTAWRTQHHPPYLPCCPPVCVLCCAGTTRRVCWTTLAPSSSLPPCRCCWCAPCPQKRQRRATCTSAPVRAALGGVGATAPRAAVCVCVCVCSRLGARRVHRPPIAPPPPPPAPAPSHSPPLPRCSRSLEADARGGLRRLTPKLHVGVVHRELLLHNLPLLALRCRLDVLGLRGWGGSTRACV